MSRRDSDSEKVPAALYDRLTDTPTYAARMYKVQLRERVKGLEHLAEYNRQQLADADWRYQQLLEQLSSSQRISENLTRSLPAGELTDEPPQRRRWWPFGKSHAGR